MWRVILPTTARHRERAVFVHPGMMILFFLFEMVSQTEQHKKTKGMEHEEKAFETCIFCFSPFDTFFSGGQLFFVEFPWLC